jgi:hypothetical protein
VFQAIFVIGGQVRPFLKAVCARRGERAASDRCQDQLKSDIRAGNPAWNEVVGPFEF